MDPFSTNYALASAAALHPLLGPAALYLNHHHPLHHLQRKIHHAPPPADQPPASPSSLSSSLSTCSDNSKKTADIGSCGEEPAPKRPKSETALLPDDNASGRQTVNAECVVCGDKSSGKHYGQLTCEGCKSFFKRSVRRNVQYICRNNNDCPVDLNHRNQCQHCRLRKCYEVGMRREAVQRGRVPLSFHPFHHNGQNFYKSTTAAPSSSSSIQRKDFSSKSSKTATIVAFPDFITQLLAAEPYSPRLGLEFALSNVENGLLSIDQLGELSARILFTAIEWARNLHIFYELKLTDQIALLCSSWPELFLLNMAQCNVVLHAASFLAAANLYSPPTTTPDAMTGGDRVLYFMDLICKFQQKVEKLRSLKLDVAEYACLKALVLFSPDAFGLTDICKIENLQEKVQTTLEEYCNAKNRPPINNDKINSSSRSRFGKLLLRLPSLRAIGSLTIEQLFFVRTVGKMPVETVIKDILLSSSCSLNNDSKNLETKIFSPRHHHQNLFNNSLPPVGSWIH